MKNVLRNAGSDFSASIVVFLVALPLCLGIALASGAPLFSGIIAGIVGGIIVGSLSGSQLSVSGPAAGLTTIVAAGIIKVPAYEGFLLAVAIAGVLQLIFGYAKAGIIGDYIPGSVIKGMLAAIGLTLILKQFPHLVGYDVNFEGDESFIQSNKENTFSGIFNALNFVSPAAIIIGLLSLLVQIGWEKFLVKKAKIFQFIPAPLVVVIVSVIINQYLISQESQWALKNGHMVSLPIADSFNSFMGLFTLPDFKYISNTGVWTTAITLAIVASLETLLNVEAADELDPHKRVTPTNRELKAQGIGNLVSGMIGGLPVTSVIVRTSANVHAGAKSKMAAVFHGVLLLLCVALIPGLLNKIPLCALAAVLIYTGFKLAKPAVFREFYRNGWDQFIPFIITIVAILFTDLLVGILVGIAAGLLFVIRSNFKSAVLVVNDGDKYLVRLRKDVYFLNKPIIKNKLEKVPANGFVMIDLSRAEFIDKDVIEVINDFLKHAYLKGIRVEVKRGGHNALHQMISSQI